MANDLFGGLGNLGGALGGLMSGLAKSGLAPSDDPAMQLLNAQSELNDLQKQEADILTEIGRRAFEQNPGMWQEADKLNLIRANINSASAKLNAMKSEQEAAEQAAQKAQEAADAATRCPSCGHGNPDGVKFCQECGTKLGPAFCGSCGAQLQPGVSFCGECGARQAGV